MTMLGVLVVAALLFGGAYLISDAQMGKKEKCKKKVTLENKNADYNDLYFEDDKVYKEEDSENKYDFYSKDDTENKYVDELNEEQNEQKKEEPKKESNWDMNDSYLNN